MPDNKHFRVDFNNGTQLIALADSAKTVEGWHPGATVTPLVTFRYVMREPFEEPVEGFIAAEDEALACSAIVRQNTDILDLGTWGAPPKVMNYEQDAPGRWHLLWADEPGDEPSRIDFELWARP